MSLDIVLLPGDGIGPEVLAQSRRVVERAAEIFGLDLDFTQIPCGGKYYLEEGDEWPPGSLDRCRRADAILLGAVGHVGPEGTTVRRADGELAGYEMVIGLRMKLDLYANLRPVRLYEGVPHRIGRSFKKVWPPEAVDFVVFRENTEDAYVRGAFELDRGGRREMVTSPIVITERGAERICRRAFELAVRRVEERAAAGRPPRPPRVTCTDKSNIVRAHALFRQVFFEVARDFPQVEAEGAYTDALTQWMIREPERYDVIVAPNFPGDVVSDLASVLQGGMGVAAGANLGDQHGLFEPIHGSAPPLAGRDVANPVAAILAAALMLDWLGRKTSQPELALAARAIEGAVARVFREGTHLPEDLGGTAGTRRMGEAIAAALTEGPID